MNIESGARYLAQKNVLTHGRIHPTNLKELIRIDARDEGSVQLN